jgi:hypothetical protein
MSSLNKLTQKRKYHININVLPKQLKYIKYNTVNINALRKNYKSIRHIAGTEYDLGELTNYHKFLSVHECNIDERLIMHNRITNEIYIPERLLKTEQDRQYFPIYMRIKEGEYHAGVLLWDKKMNELCYYDSWGHAPHYMLSNALFKMFPDINDIIYNNINHQTQKHMCTTYAFNVANRFMKGEVFKNICANRTTMEDLLTYRERIKQSIHNVSADHICGLCNAMC